MLNNKLPTDWGEWHNPPRDWVVQHAAVPGLQWGFDKLGQVESVRVHRSHEPLLPMHEITGIPRPEPGL